MQNWFHDRSAAGQRLAELLAAYADRQDVVVLALPRGGVPVGFEVAHALHAPLDVLMVRKLGVPGFKELAMGAIAVGGVRVLNHDVIAALKIPVSAIVAAAQREQCVLERRERLYRDERPPANLAGQTVILVDDGLATGMTMRAAIAAVRRHGPAAVVVAVPTIALESCAEVRAAANVLVWVLAPDPFYAVGQCYADFRATTDAEVCMLLARAAAEQPCLATDVRV